MIDFDGLKNVLLRTHGALDLLEPQPNQEVE